MKHEDLVGYARFRIKKEPNSLFYKECSRYDGACNSYKIKDNGANILEPIIFSRDYEVQEVRNAE